MTMRMTRRQLVQRGAAGATLLSLPNLLAACGGGGGGGGGGGPGPDDEPPTPSSPGADWDSFEADFWRHVERDRVQGSKR